MNEAHRCVRCGYPVPASAVDSGAAAELMASMAREIQCLRQTVAWLRGSGRGRTVRTQRRRHDTG